MNREIKFKEMQDDGTWLPFVLQNGDGKHNWLQYTGLKDKNGKEIYEGDILQDEEGDIFQIIWKPSEAQFVGDLFGEKGFVYHELGMQDLFGLVIGNIYENPELLK